MTAGDLPPMTAAETIEAALRVLDRLTLMVQQLRADVDRAGLSDVVLGAEGDRPLEA